jgi:hypothetical protein
MNKPLPLSIHTGKVDWLTRRNRSAFKGKIPEKEGLNFRFSQLPDGKKDPGPPTDSYYFKGKESFSLRAYGLFR